MAHGDRLIRDRETPPAGHQHIRVCNSDGEFLHLLNQQVVRLAAELANNPLTATLVDLKEIIVTIRATRRFRESIIDDFRQRPKFGKVDSFNALLKTAAEQFDRDPTETTLADMFEVVDRVCIVLEGVTPSYLETLRQTKLQSLGGFHERRVLSALS